MLLVAAAQLLVVLEDEEEAVRQVAADAAARAAAAMGLVADVSMDPEAAVRLLHDVLTRALGPTPCHVAYLAARLVPLNDAAAPLLSAAW